MWKRIFNYNITDTDNYKNIHELLKAHGYSSTIIRHLKETENGIQKNGVWARVHDSLEPGDTVTLALVENESSENIVPTPLPLNIVYEDEDLLVINKAAGVPIHPSQGNFDNTLANACAYYFQQKGEPFTYRCINRLDRDTTGLLIIARHCYSASLLSNMVAKREIHREYLALAEGLVPDEGVIEAPIARVDGSTIEREVNFETGEFARTNFKRIEYYNRISLARFSACDGLRKQHLHFRRSAILAKRRFSLSRVPLLNRKGYSLVSLKLDTGRTHQIRVHMKHIGHPLPGDFLYNPNYDVIQRQALHSHKLSFKHPITGEMLSFTAELPGDMKIF